MPKTTQSQDKTVGRVMHEFRHGELKSGPGGKGGKVKNRRQAIAIALNEAGASQYETPAENKEHLAHTKAKEARGATAQQEAEGKSHVGAAGEPASSPAMRRKAKTSRKGGAKESSRTMHAAGKGPKTRAKTANGRKAKRK